MCSTVWDQYIACLFIQVGWGRFVQNKLSIRVFSLSRSVALQSLFPVYWNAISVDVTEICLPLLAFLLFLLTTLLIGHMTYTSRSVNNCSISRPSTAYRSVFHMHRLFRNTSWFALLIMHFPMQLLHIKHAFCQRTEGLWNCCTQTFIALYLFTYWQCFVDLSINFSWIC